MGEGGDEVVARAGDAGADRADRTVADLRDLGVGQPEQLCQDECNTPIWHQTGYELSQHNRVRDVAAYESGTPPSRTRCGQTDGLVEAGGDCRPPAARAEVVHRDSSGDSEQPRTSGRLTPIGRKRAECPKICLLSKIACLVVRHKVCMQAPEISLRGPDEIRCGRLVPGARGDGGASHSVMPHRRSPQPPARVRTRAPAFRNHHPNGSDYLTMRCSDWREATSAIIDGELVEGLALDDLAAHEAVCEPCRTWRAQAEQITRGYRIGPADQVPDLVADVLSLTEPVRRRRRSLTRVLRAALIVVAISQLILTLPAFAIADAESTHVTHEVAAFNAALAIGLFWVALWPYRAIGLLPVMTALVGILVTITVPDILVGHVHWERETMHVLLVIALGLLAALAKRSDGTPDVPRSPGVDGRPATGRALIGVHGEGAVPRPARRQAGSASISAAGQITSGRQDRAA